MSLIHCNVSDELTDKQKRRQVQRIHDILFEVLEDGVEGEPTLVAMEDEYMEIFNRFFPVKEEMKVEELEDRILACVKEITTLIVSKDDAVNADYAKLVIYYLLMQLITQNLSVREVNLSSDDIMYG